MPLCAAERDRTVGADMQRCGISKVFYLSRDK